MILKIIEGNFYQGEFVTVSVGNEKIKRKVHYSGMAGDLYIWYKNNMYFYSEFQRGYSGDEPDEKEEILKKLRDPNLSTEEKNKLLEQLYKDIDITV